jgi:GMP synthase-like glutamine amidotransferase
VRALAIVHQQDAGPGVFADEMRSRGVELEEWGMSRRGEAPPREIAAYDAILTFGGAMHADQEDKHPWLRFEKDFLAAIVEDEVPILAVCLGAQLLAEAAEGAAHRASEPEIGWHRVEVTPEGEDDPLLGPLAPDFSAFMWHSYEFAAPPGASVLARSAICDQAYRVGERAWGIQFHAEVTPASAFRWIEKEREGDEASASDPDALRQETERRIDDWNRLGRELCGRFIDQVASPSG